MNRIYNISGLITAGRILTQISDILDTSVTKLLVAAIFNQLNVTMPMPCITLNTVSQCQHSRLIHILDDTSLNFEPLSVPSTNST